MRDIVTALGRWWAADRTFALATVVDVIGSAPRQPGAALAVNAGGDVVGSVAGGCIEAAVYELARASVRTRTPARVRYGISNDDALGMGLTCGGEIDVLVEPVDSDSVPFFGDVVAAVAAEEPVALATVVSGAGHLGARMAVWPDRAAGSLGPADVTAAVRDDARAMLEVGQTGIRAYRPQGQRGGDDVEVFVSPFAPRPQMLVFGATDFARAMTQVGRLLDYRVTVCDARSRFATKDRFPDADAVVVDWPHRYLQKAKVDARTVICVLTHDAKFDVPLLELALATKAAYIGAMGSRRTHDERLTALRERGVASEQLARLVSPIGLDLGARTPEETAIAIAAHIVQQRRGGSGLPLVSTTGPIHDSRRTA